MNEPLVYVGICPVCEGGVCRVRICGLDSPSVHGLVVCDECEAIWTEPNLETPYQFSSPAEPICPLCGSNLWSPTSRWATPEDLSFLGWSDRASIQEDDADADDWLGDDQTPA